MRMMLMAGLVWATEVQEVSNPRPDGWVTDMANVLDEDQEAALNLQIDSLHDDLGVEVAVVTIGNSGDRTPKQFATALFNTWGIGSAERNDGLLVLLALEQRRLEMETGYGLEAPLPDGWLGAMQATHMVPAFKEGAYGDGLVAGLDQVDRRLRDQADRIGASDFGADTRPTDVGDSAAGEGLPVKEVVAVGGGGLALGGLSLGLMGWRRRRPKCETCGEKMVLLSEEEEDAHLTEGQQMEEVVRSSQWLVFWCAPCEAVQTRQLRRWFSGYDQCPSCFHRTRRTTSTVEVAATEYSTGRRRVNESCAHCPHSASYTRVIPRRPKQSSSSSSGGGFSSGGGGGGFGGGSSGGGGAGSSW